VERRYEADDEQEAVAHILRNLRDKIETNRILDDKIQGKDDHANGNKLRRAELAGITFLSGAVTAVRMDETSRFVAR
jgi:hypothetical protein